MIDAFLELEARVERILAGESGLSRDALASVFRLNTRIGRLSARDAKRRGGLKGLQLAVNGITVAIKRGDVALLRESIESTRNEIRSVVPR